MLFPGATFKVGDVENEPLPFRTGQFKTVVCTEVLEHIQRHDLLLAEMKRVAQEYIVFTVPTAMGGVGHIYPEWSHQDVRELASSLGTVIEVHSYYEARFHLAWVRRTT